jgi:hypothetical protein
MPDCWFVDILSSSEFNSDYWKQRRIAPTKPDAQNTVSDLNTIIRKL